MEGEHALGEHPDPQDFFQASVDVYYEWDTLRKAPLQPAAQPPTAIVHGGSGFAHAGRATAPVLAAWRTGDSALSPGLDAWGAAAAAGTARLPGWQSRTRTRPMRGLAPDRRACWPRRCGCCWSGRSAT